MALKLTSEEVKLLLNFTQGKLGSKSVKEWVRVHETNLDLTKTTSSTTASSTDKRASMILLAEDEIEHGNDYPDDDGDLEILLNAMTSLDSDDGTISEDSNQVFDEDEVKEVLAAMIRSHGKGGQAYPHGCEPGQTFQRTGQRLWGRTSCWSPLPKW